VPLVGPGEHEHAGQAHQRGLIPRRAEIEFVQ